MPLYLGCPRQKILDHRDGNKRKRTSLLTGYRDNKLIAPFLFDGTCNTAVFNVWLENVLLPELAPGTLLILDNAACHKTESTSLIVEQAGCHLLFLPPYSPHLNPIEKLWANLKRYWRNHAYLSLEELIKSSKYLSD